MRGYIGVVPQETTLFDATIEQNIMYGKPNATADEVKCAAKKARIHDRIMTQPEVGRVQTQKTCRVIFLN